MIVINPLFHEVVHYGFYELNGFSSNIRIRVMGRLRDREVPAVNLYVVTPEQLIPNQIAAIGYILPFITLTPLYFVLIWHNPNPLIDILFGFAIVQNIAGSTLDMRDFINSIYRDSKARLWMIETENYARTFVGFPTND
jgi:hypothetical protein